MLSDVAVERGEHVEAGTWLGATGVAHPGGHEGLHFSLRIQERYTDPMAYLGPLDLAGAIHLAPVLERPEDLAAGSGACEPAGRPARTAAPPNDNIAVLVAGINSATRGGVAPELYALGPRLLGYPESRLYRFSYAGPAGPDLHRPYAVGDTWGGLGLAAARLRELLERIGRRHPDEGVDLIAHSQGGIVARILLQNLWAWEHDVPHIEHLVTLSTPHAGAPLSGEIAQLDDATGTGGWFVDALAAWSRRGGGVPDPRSSAVAQLAPGSGLLERLASEDIVYGTRALALTMPNDVIVPSDRARLPYEVNRVVRPEGWDGHAGSVRSLPARALVRSFLSGDPMSCSTRWDVWGPALGRVIGLAESATAEAIGAAGATMPGAGLASRTPGRSWGPAAGQKKEPPPPGGMGG